ncbi:hypothetical protein [Paraburkholderia fungorum]|uniref:hypothetical protein n=1 Tax=Paraburkholderia fungorum TaxID=134537 RepID=UPI0011EA70EF|nr:hypothetical protein [Paraburkholderia fungorum]
MLPFFVNFADLELSRFGQAVFRHAYVLARLLDYIENRPYEPANAEIARCAVMFYAGVHFGRRQVGFWAPDRSGMRPGGSSQPSSLSKAPTRQASPTTQPGQIAAKVWGNMDWSYTQQYLPL